MKSRLAIIIFITAALAIASAYVRGPGLPALAPELNAKLEGFTPGSKVTYKITPKQGETAAGEAVVDAKGGLEIPPYSLFKAETDYLAYEFHIYEGENKPPLDVTLGFDAKTGNIITSCNGVKPFANIGVKGADSEFMTHADWAGILQSKAQGSIGVLQSEEGFRLAFYDSNLMNDANKDPRVIKVFQATGGGGLTNSNVNKGFSFPQGCTVSGASTRFSVCRGGDTWLQTTKVVNTYVRGLEMMAEQFSAVMMHQMAIVGTMLDAKQQLEAQRELQALTAEAHKDYQPSGLMCEFGSFTKSLGAQDMKVTYEKEAINDILQSFYYNTEHTSGAEGYAGDIESRVQQFRKIYCDPKDNNDGLNFMCDHDQIGGGAKGGSPASRLNKDIDFSRTLGDPLTLNIDYAYSHQTAATKTRTSTADEADVIALAKNLYWPEVLPMNNDVQISKKFAKYLDIRKLFAMTNVAHDSFASLAAMKAKSAPARDGTGAAIDDGPAFMKAMMRNFGLSDADIVSMVGENPSYWAQMDVLTKKIYQSPDFYTNLYDKPANVERIGATLDAIKLMQNRDMLESSLRKEMLTSLMVEEALAKHIDSINGRAVSEIKNLQHK